MIQLSTRSRFDKRVHVFARLSFTPEFFGVAFLLVVDARLFVFQQTGPTLSLRSTPLATKNTPQSRIENALEIVAPPSTLTLKTSPSQINCQRSHCTQCTEQVPHVLRLCHSSAVVFSSLRSSEMMADTIASDVSKQDVWVVFYFSVCKICTPSLATKGTRLSP